MRQAMRRDIERARRDEHQDLAQRMVDADAGGEKQEAAEKSDIERDEAEAHRERQTNAAAEDRSIDLCDAGRKKVDQLAPSLHRGDCAPEAEDSQVRRPSGPELALGGRECALDLGVVHAASVSLLRASGAECRTCRRARDRRAR